MYDFNINKLKNNDNIIDAFLVKSVDQDKTKNDVPYLNVTLSNINGDVNCRLWDSTENDLQFFKNNDLVKIMGTVNEFQGNKQLIIKKYKESTEADKIDASKLIRTTKVDVEEVYNGMLELVKSFENITLRLLTKSLLIDYKDLIKIAGASKIHHHNIVGGWLEHTSTMLEDGKLLAQKYSNNINEELLYSGIILHDIGKLKEFKFNRYGIVEDYTVEGELLGHITIGIQMITEYQNKLWNAEDEIDNNIIVLLKHLILTHHGKPEFGSPKYPMTKEAELLSSLDMLDTKMYMFDEVISDLNENEFSKRQWSLDNRKIYNKIQ